MSKRSVRDHSRPGRPLAICSPAGSPDHAIQGCAPDLGYDHRAVASEAVQDVARLDEGYCLISDYPRRAEVLGISQDPIAGPKLLASLGQKIGRYLPCMRLVHSHD